MCSPKTVQQGKTAGLFKQRMQKQKYYDRPEKAIRETLVVLFKHGEYARHPHGPNGPFCTEGRVGQACRSCWHSRASQSSVPAAGCMCGSSGNLSN